MIRFVLQLILAVLAMRLVVRALRRPRPAAPRFDPEAGARRENSRDPGGDPDLDIVDAEYEEIPEK